MANAAALVLAGIMVSVLLYSAVSFFDNASNMKPSAGSAYRAIQGNSSAANIGVLKTYDFLPILFGILAFLGALVALMGLLH